MERSLAPYAQELWEILLYCGFGLFLGPPKGNDIEYAELGELPGVVEEVPPTSAGSLEGLVAYPLQELPEGNPDKPRLDEILGPVGRQRAPDQAVQECHGRACSSPAAVALGEVDLEIAPRVAHHHEIEGAAADLGQGLKTGRDIQ